MTRFEFRVTAVFDIRDRSVLAVVGTVLQGFARPGSVVRDVATGHCFHLVGTDLVCAPNRRQSRFSLLVSRAEVDYARPGRLWVAEEA